VSLGPALPDSGVAAASGRNAPLARLRKSKPRAARPMKGLSGAFSRPSSASVVFTIFTPRRSF
jgi:hypothetical protein